MRILMVSRTPFVHELGGGRVQLEIGEALATLGHQVEFFDVVTAFGGDGVRRRDRFAPLRFARAARAFVRQSPDRWDVIDADQGDLPFSKRELGFRGVLVARSAGLYAFYREFKQLERRRWPERIPGSWIGKRIDRLGADRVFAAAEHSMRLCDLALVPTREEQGFLTRELGLASRCVALPFGLSDDRHDAFAAARRPASDRLENVCVAFIGSWTPRKGAADWASIIRLVRERRPDARFLFVGTGCNGSEVLRDVDDVDRSSVTVVPEFASDDLPGLLSGATVGAFPSYVEGFGFGILETLAAGLPTVAYDVSGPRAMLGAELGALVPVGDVDSFARQIVALLSAEPDTYAALSRRCVATADGFRWRGIAASTADAYAAALATASDR
ncbi:MAG TPA: glycosyltransferase family 4 protein [Gaiellaceae bacterium]|nr:glycosyltransferase family 4 protein [Gaiellaceae bacterium]